MSPPEPVFPLLLYDTWEAFVILSLCLDPFDFISPKDLITKTISNRSDVTSVVSINHLRSKVIFMEQLFYRQLRKCIMVVSAWDYIVGNLVFFCCVYFRTHCPRGDCNTF